MRTTGQPPDRSAGRRQRQMTYTIRRILSFFLTVLAFFGLIKPVPEGIMNYTEEELALLDEYLAYSQGAAVSLYETKDAAEPIYTGTVDDLCALPDCNQLARAGYIKYTAYIAFEKAGNQRLKIDGAKNAAITVYYNELRSEKYSVNTVFKENVFYRIDVGFPYKEGLAPSFRAGSAYRLSVSYPSFGGIPSGGIAPVADIHLRDPFIMTGADGRYYMTGTYDPVDWSNTKEIHVFRSDDLADWEDLGAVWNFERDATWQKKLLTDGSSPIWAPELHYINGNYSICYSLGWGAMNGSVLKSTTGLPEGPYEDVRGGAIFDAIDSTFFVDDDGSVYAIRGDGRCAKMSRDMKYALAPSLSLVSESGQPVGFEGCCVLKINGLYYLCSASYTTHYRADGSSYQTYDSYYAVASRFQGPYSERRLLLINGGHGNLFFAKDGTLYTTLFSGALNERPGIAAIDIAEDGRLYVR